MNPLLLRLAPLGALALVLALGWRGQAGVGEAPAAVVAEPAVRSPAPALPPEPRASAAALSLTLQAPLAAPAPALFGMNGRVVDLQGLGVAALLDARLPAARQGDAQAAYAVYQALALCATLDEAGAGAGVEQAAVQARCTGVSLRQRQERQQWLNQAAAAGLVDAQVDFYVDGRRSQGAAVPEDPAWKAEALTHLQHAATACDLYALGQLATLNGSGELAPPHAGEAVRYAVAASLARGQAPSAERLREDFAPDLGEANFLAAWASGQELARTACHRG
jgi:hypothetical protein